MTNYKTHNTGVHGADILSYVFKERCLKRYRQIEETS